MLRKASRALLVGWARQVARLPLTRRAIHALSVAARGPAILFLRVRRVLPDTAHGRAHPDRTTGTAMLPDELRRSLLAVRQTLPFIHAGEAVQALTTGARIERAAAVLTFDESFAATLEAALPVLRELQVPALTFVSTGFLEHGGTLWDQEIHTLLSRLAPEPLSVPWIDSILRTDRADKRVESTRRLLLSLVDLDENGLMRRLAELRDRAGDALTTPGLDRMLTRAEVARLAHDPLISLGAHGHLHFALARVSDAMLDEELAKPRQILKEIAGPAFADVVSYPFGRAPYVDDRVVSRARAAGYRAGFTANAGVARPGDHLFTIPRAPLSPGALDAYELQGVSDAVDELLYVATGTEDRVIAELEG